MTTLAVPRLATPRHRPDDRLSHEDWRVLDQLLRRGAIAEGAASSEVQLNRLAAEGLIVRLPPAPGQAAAVLITGWGEIRWRQALRRRRRARLTDRPGRL